MDPGHLYRLVLLLILPGLIKGGNPAT